MLLGETQWTGLLGTLSCSSSPRPGQAEARPRAPRRAGPAAEMPQAWVTGPSLQPPRCQEASPASEEQQERSTASQPSTAAPQLTQVVHGPPPLPPPSEERGGQSCCVHFTAEHVGKARNHQPGQGPDRPLTLERGRSLPNATLRKPHRRGVGGVGGWEGTAASPQSSEGVSPLLPPCCDVGQDTVPTLEATSRHYPGPAH